MRILLLFAALCVLLPVSPAAATGGRHPSCDERARTLERFEEAADHAAAIPGFVGKLLTRIFEQLARTSARRYADRCVRLNEVQQLGSHNSYHVEPPQLLIDIYTAVDPAAVGWQYTHRPLGEQFAQLGIRQIPPRLSMVPDCSGGTQGNTGPPLAA